MISDGGPPDQLGIRFGNEASRTGRIRGLGAGWRRGVVRLLARFELRKQRGERRRQRLADRIVVRLEASPDHEQPRQPVIR